MIEENTPDRETHGINLIEKDLAKSINDYLNEMFLDLPPHKEIVSPKVIHDSVHGSNIFNPYEVAFLDIPPVQRLRRISQTDVASYVFPAGNHNRFEHTVGVASVAARMVQAIFARGVPNEIKVNEEYIHHNCVVAAILHDCGHGPFSHLSEQLYENELKFLKTQNPILSGASAHEIISYFIATSSRMRQFNDEVIKGIYNIDIDLDLVGQMIVGYIDKENKSEVAFAIEVINGAFDADKLDYILRDAHATGLQMALDIPRLMYTLNVQPDEHGIYRLAIDISGVTALEEIVFNKMMLTSTIYHHHKVRAAGCLLKSIMQNCGLFNNVIDYLRFTDDQVLSIETTDEQLKSDLRLLKSRHLPKRAFCFSTRTLDDPTVLYKLMEAFRDPEFSKGVVENICERAAEATGEKITVDNVWVDSPNPPKFKEATNCMIRSIGSPNNYLPLREVFPTDDWVKAFSENKWHGFIFCEEKNRKAVYEASQSVFEEVFETKFNEFSHVLCKIR